MTGFSAHIGNNTLVIYFKLSSFENMTFPKLSRNARYHIKLYQRDVLGISKNYPSLQNTDFIIYHYFVIDSAILYE